MLTLGTNEVRRLKETEDRGKAGKAEEVETEQRKIIQCGRVGNGKELDYFFFSLTGKNQIVTM